MCKSVAAVFVELLIEDESWQGEFTDDERAIWLHAAGAHFRLSARNGRDLAREYRRVLLILKGARNWDTT